MKTGQDQTEHAVKDYDYYIRKLRQMPEKFMELYHQRDFGRAKICYNHALTIAFFLEIDLDLQHELFGDFREHLEHPVDGLFPAGMVHYCYEVSSVYGNQNPDHMLYRRYGEEQRYGD